MFTILIVFYVTCQSTLIAQSGCDNCAYVDVLYVGSNFSLPNLTAAIAAGQMSAEPTSGDLSDPTNWPSQRIVISGSFTFNNPDGYEYYTLYNSDIYMDACAQVFIPNTGMKVQFWNSKVTGCDCMWRRIQVGNGGKLLMHNTLIRDGIHAIELMPNSESEFRQCTFRDNYIGIITPELPAPPNSEEPPLYSYGKFQVEGCTFHNLDGLLSNPGCITTNADIAYKGIQIQSISFVKIGHKNSVFGTNLFENLISGIDLKYTNARIENSKFHNIYHQGNSDFLAQTSAVRSVGSQFYQFNLDFEGLGQESTNMTFFNVRHAFFIERINANIVKSFGERVLQVVLNRQSQYKQFYFKDNVFNCHMGILDANGGGGIKYHNTLDNVFNLHDYQNTSLGPYFGFEAGISLGYNIHFSNKNQAGIKQNQFNIYHAKPAIRISQVKELLVKDNDINIFLERDKSFAAINIIGTYPQFGSNYIRQNVIHDNSTSGSANHIGIGNLHSRMNQFSCNYAYDVDEGFLFRGYCHDTDFAKNGLYAQKTGLAIKNFIYNTIIGEQDSKMNLWGDQNSYSIAGASHYSNKESVTSLSRFLVHTMNLPYWPDPLIDPSSQWFLHRGNQEDDCTIAPSDNWPSKVNLTWTDFQVIGDSLEDINTYDHWQLRYHLFQKLHFNDTLLTNNQSAMDWYEDSEQNNIGDLIFLQDKIWYEALYADEQFIQDREDRFEHIQLILSRIYDIDSLVVQGNNSQVLDELDSLKVILMTIYVSDSIGWEQVLTDRDSVLTEVLTFYENYVPDHLYELYLYQVYGVFLDMIITNLPAPDSLGKEIINSIASMCVDEGGQATIFAREIQSTYDFIEYDDEVLCDSVSFRADNEHYPNERRILSNAFIFPNPTDGSIFLHAPASNGIFILRNITGSVLVSRNINMTNRSILIDGLDFLNPGLYIWQYIGTQNEINESGIMVRK